LPDPEKRRGSPEEARIVDRERAQRGDQRKKSPPHQWVTWQQTFVLNNVLVEYSAPEFVLGCHEQRRNPVLCNESAPDDRDEGGVARNDGQLSCEVPVLGPQHLFGQFFGILKLKALQGGEAEHVRRIKSAGYSFIDVSLPTWSGAHYQLASPCLEQLAPERQELCQFREAVRIISNDKYPSSGDLFWCLNMPNCSLP
jgi:hypothetical protein